MKLQNRCGLELLLREADTWIGLQGLTQLRGKVLSSLSSKSLSQRSFWA